MEAMERIKGLMDEKAVEKWAGEFGTWKDKMVHELANELSKRGFSSENPAAAKDVKAAEQFLAAKRQLVEAKVDETFTPENIAAAHLDCIIKVQVDETQEFRVICQSPRHAGANMAVLPTQKFIVRKNADGELTRMCHQGTSEAIVTGDFLVTGEGRIMRFCPFCKDKAIAAARERGEKLTFYRLGEAVNKISRIRENEAREAEENAKREAEAERMEHSASRQIAGKRVDSRRADFNRRHTSGLKRASGKLARDLMSED